jgi:hypothetical protein
VALAGLDAEAAAWTAAAQPRAAGTKNVEALDVEAIDVQASENESAGERADRLLLDDAWRRAEASASP